MRAMGLQDGASEKPLLNSNRIFPPHAVCCCFLLLCFLFLNCVNPSGFFFSFFFLNQQGEKAMKNQLHRRASYVLVFLAHQQTLENQASNCVRAHQLKWGGIGVRYEPTENSC
jgi:hypothetical protein